MIGQILRDNKDISNSNETSVKIIRDRVDEVTHRLYHVARLVQVYFENPTHGNYSDPFLESLFIILTWRGRISFAQNVIDELQHEFSSPIDILEPKAFDTVNKIVGRAGFSGKRPEMVIELVRLFFSQFPNGKFNVLKSWSDNDVIEFLTSAPGIGKKSALCVCVFSLNRKRFPVDTHIRRVLRRANLLKGLFEETALLGHRGFQEAVEKFISPSVRQSLHTGLLSIGQSFCKTRKPKCNECPINKNCEYYRKNKVNEESKKKFTHIDMFCGAGGFGQGLNSAGFKTILAADIDPDATRTFRLNHPGVPERKVLTIDLEKTEIEKVCSSLAMWKEILSNGEIDVITAGIPCQGFSKAGNRSRGNNGYEIVKDPRNHLYKVVIKWTRAIKPKYVIIENVPSIQSAWADEENILEAVQGAFEEISYSAVFKTINASIYGIPQTRRRFILIATHPDYPTVELDMLSKYRQARISLWDAIGNYPRIRSGKGSWYVHTGKNVITSHVSRYNNEYDLKIFKAIKQGEHYRDFIKRRADIIEDRINNSDFKTYGTSSFGDKYHKLIGNEPSRTIVAHLRRDGNGYIHPRQNRSISPREAARLQSFRDDFVFTGSRGVQFTQIGNAVPPILAQAIGNLIIDTLSSTKEK